MPALPPEDPDVYEMLCRADSVGVFQVESRAQMSMLPRLRPRTFYDLVIEVSIVRPGPIQGDMVHPYLRRREGREQVSYPKEELRAVLGKTLGVPLFQEQAMKIAIVAAGFSPEEADRLRRSMASFRNMGTVSAFRDKMVEGMVANGYERDFAERCFRQIEGFGDYGFPESHAASFALLVYASAWVKRHYPDAFAAALLNSQPMGFYAPAQIVRDARGHGVAVRPADVNESAWDCTLEDAGGRLRALRLGLRQVKGFSQEGADKIVTARDRDGRFCDIADMAARTGLDAATLGSASPAPTRSARSASPGAPRYGPCAASKRWPRRCPCSRRAATAGPVSVTASPRRPCPRSLPARRWPRTIACCACPCATIRCACCATASTGSASGRAARWPRSGTAHGCGSPGWCWHASDRARPRV